MSNLYTHESGQTGAPLIVLLHGSPLSGRMWEPQLELLAGDFHCLAPDLPGHGRSASQSFKMDEVVVELADLIRQHGTDGRAHIVGLSFGGVVAQALMSARPEVVDHAILSGTAAELGSVMMSVLRFQIRANEPIVNRMSAGSLAGLIGRQFGVPDSYRPMLAEDIKMASPAVYSEAILTTYSDIRTPVRTGSPTLVVVGEKETWAAKSMARRLVATIPGAAGRVAPGGHVWNLQHPALFAEVVRAWVGDRPLPMELRLI